MWLESRMFVDLSFEVLKFVRLRMMDEVKKKFLYRQVQDKRMSWFFICFHTSFFIVTISQISKPHLSDQPTRRFIFLPIFSRAYSHSLIYSALSFTFLHPLQIFPSVSSPTPSKNAQIPSLSSHTFLFFFISSLPGSPLSLYYS